MKVGGFIDFYLSMHYRWLGHVARLRPERWAYRAASWLYLRWKNEGVLNKNWNAYIPDFRWKLRGIGNTNKFTFDGLVHNWTQLSGAGSWWVLASDGPMARI